MENTRISPFEYDELNVNSYNLQYKSTLLSKKRKKDYFIGVTPNIELNDIDSLLFKVNENCQTYDKIQIPNII